jgi:hypothetical protein
MSNNPKLQDDPQNNAVKDPQDWVTGDEPATGAQKSYLHTLAEAAGEEVPEKLTKAHPPNSSSNSRRRPDAAKTVRKGLGVGVGEALSGPHARCGTMWRADRRGRDRRAFKP